MPTYTPNQVPSQYPVITLVNPDGTAYDPSTAIAPGTYNAPADRFPPSTAIRENFPRLGSTITNVATLLSGRMHMVAIYLPNNTTITSMTFVTGTTAVATPTNQWFALYNSSRNLLRQTIDDTTAAWAANTVKTLNLTSTFTTTYSGLHYAAVMVAATTVPSLLAVVHGASVISGIAPILAGSSTTGLTNAAPATAAAISANTALVYCWVS